MPYSVKKGFENQKVGAKIFDGRKVFNGLLKDATQEELEELHLIGVPNIIEEKAKAKKRKSKKRDNSPSEPLPLPPENE